jgi:hypothetical protein
MTRIEFRYDLDKDISNFIAGTSAKNNSKPTRLQQLYIDVYGTDYDRIKVQTFIESYISEGSLDVVKCKEVIEQNWRKIENSYFEKAERLFGVSYADQQIVAYLTTNQRCTYNLKEKYFFVNLSSKSPNLTIMHELFHFYTWQAYHDSLIKAGINENQYNDIKESLTVLLNVEFVDLMDGVRDDGYPQHAGMRQEVQELWSRSKDLRKVIFEVFSLSDSGVSN